MPLAIAMKLLQVGVVVWLAVLFRRTRSSDDRAALWPFAFGLFTLVGPIAWCYHYLATVAFAPMLIQRLRLLPRPLKILRLRLLHLLRLLRLRNPLLLQLLLLRCSRLNSIWPRLRRKSRS